MYAVQVKALGKKAQQTTPTGSPTKPQPLQRAGPLEAVNVGVVNCCCASACIVHCWLVHLVLLLLACFAVDSEGKVLYAPAQSVAMCIVRVLRRCPLASLV